MTEAQPTAQAAVAETAAAQQFQTLAELYGWIEATLRTIDLCWIEQSPSFSSKAVDPLSKGRLPRAAGDSAQPIGVDELWAWGASADGTPAAVHALRAARGYSAFPHIGRAASETGQEVFLRPALATEPANDAATLPPERKLHYEHSEAKSRLFLSEMPAATAANADNTNR